MFQVRLNGKLVNFESLQLSDSIEQLVAQYSISFHDKDIIKEVFKNKDSIITIFYKDELIKTCYIDTAEEEISTEGTTMTISGRSKLCDIVDSAATNLDFMNKIRFVDMISKIVKPFGVKVKNLANVKGTLENVQFGSSSTVFDCVNKYTRNFKVILDEDENGNLTISKRSKEVNGHYTEKNFKQITYSKNYQDLYSHYNAVSDGALGKKYTEKVKGFRYKVKNRQVDVNEDTKAIAKQMKEISISLSEIVTVEGIVGFEFLNGTRIRNNTLIRIETERVNSTFLVTGYQTDYSTEGISTNITIKREDAYYLQNEEEIL